jgi:pimeloyl-ACP methyl ester carboxylesterase
VSFTGPTSHVYISQRLRLHYVDWGNSDAPPLVMLHGWRDHCRNWDWVAAELTDRFHIIAPDLRGHGDSAWSSDGQYSMDAHVYDLSQLIHQLNLAGVAIIAHSLGGQVAIRYAGLYPQNVSRLVCIEGLGRRDEHATPDDAPDVVERMTRWIAEQRALAARQPRRYATLDEAFERMQAENRHLSAAQARHLTRHGVNQNEDGTYSWKFDNYVRVVLPNDPSAAELRRLRGRITCPTLLVYGRDSWATSPSDDGRIEHFRDASVQVFDGAGHWVHHDRTGEFVTLVRSFLDAT